MNLSHARTRSPSVAWSFPCRTIPTPPARSRVNLRSAASGAFAHAGECVFAADDSTCVEVVVACTIAQRIQRDMAFRVAWEREGAPVVEQRLKPDFVAVGVGLCVHGLPPL